ncbi:unnamed protein product [Lampetra planeri]
MRMIAHCPHGASESWATEEAARGATGDAVQQLAPPAAPGRTTWLRRTTPRRRPLTALSSLARFAKPRWVHHESQSCLHAALWFKPAACSRGHRARAAHGDGDPPVATPTHGSRSARGEGEASPPNVTRTFTTVAVPSGNSSEEAESDPPPRENIAGM